MTNPIYYGNPINGRTPLTSQQYDNTPKDIKKIYDSLIERAILAIEPVDGGFNLRLLVSGVTPQDILDARNGKGKIYDLLNGENISKPDVPLEVLINNDSSTPVSNEELIPNIVAYEKNIQRTGQFYTGLVKTLAMVVHPDGWKAIGAYMQEQRDDIIAKGNFRQLNQALGILKMYEGNDIFMGYVKKSSGLDESFSSLSPDMQLELMFQTAGKINATHQTIQIYEGVAKHVAKQRARGYRESQSILATIDTNESLVTACQGLEKSNRDAREVIPLIGEMYRLQIARYGQIPGALVYGAGFVTTNTIVNLGLGLFDGIRFAIDKRNVKNAKPKILDVTSA